MKIIKQLLLTFALVVAAVSLPAQSIVDLRLNEILIKNEGNFTDEYSRPRPWVEIYNSAYNSVNVGGCYLTNDTTGFAAAQKDKDALDKFKKKCYNIPTGDPKTLLQQRSCVVFFLDGDPTYGTFHVSFTPDQTNYVALIGSDGKTLIDLMEFPPILRDTCVSYGCVKDGDTSQMDILEFFTPGSNNTVLNGETKSDRLAKTDRFGIKMALTSMSIVFSVLAFIYIILKIFGHYSKKGFNVKSGKKEAKPAAQPAPTAGGKPSDEELAAIATALNQEMGDATDEEKVAVFTALYLYLDTQHDQESEVLTFTNLNETSPWGQKYFNFKRNPKS